MVNIPEYYAGKNLLITGATGFMGKVQQWLTGEVAIRQLQKCELHNKLRFSHCCVRKRWLIVDVCPLCFAAGYKCDV